MDFDIFDTDLWNEINDMPGEIFDIPEMQDDVVDFEKALNSAEDFWGQLTKCPLSIDTTPSNPYTWFSSNQHH